MYSGFDETIEPLLPLHLCCSNCYKHCDCGDNFEEALCELQNTLTSSTFTLFDCSGHISHGFSSQLITELTSNVQFIFIWITLFQNFPSVLSIMPLVY